MNDMLTLAGITHWKPYVSALILPPVPLLLLVLVGARVLVARRGLGWLLILLSVIGLWFSACSGTERLLAPRLLKSPPALTPDRIAELKQEAARGKTAIVVLGGGAEPSAAEYGTSNLRWMSMERLRYGVWLARRTGLPLAFSGGVGWGASDATAEADIAARIAKDEFGVPLKWAESRSRDTRGNGGLTVAMLREAGIEHIVLVTHDFHMPRSLRAFNEAAGPPMRIEAAPMGLARREDASVLEWIPSRGGFTRVHTMLHELIGLAAGS